MRQTIVITMAGRGSRFRDAGYLEPKYRIRAHGRSLFQWSLASLRHFIGPDSRLVFVCLAENDSGDYVRAECAALGIADVQVYQLDQVSDGQATSAWLSRGLWLDGAPLLIYNIDTYVDPDALSPAHIRPGSDGWVPCFPAPGAHWSFIGLGLDGWANAAAEKTRISEHASIGLYWFADGAAYVDAYQRFFAEPANLVRGERYVAPLYQQLLADGAKVSISELAMASVHPLGTPEELQRFLLAPPG